LQSIQYENNDRSVANAAFNSYLDYLGWKGRLDRVITALHDAERNCLNNNSLAETAIALESAQRADNNYQGDVVNRAGDIGIDLVKRSEKVLSDFLKSCVVIDETNDRGASSATFNSYLEWKGRLEKIIPKLKTLDCPPAETQVVASVIKGLEASNNADKVYKGGIYNRAGELEIELIMRGEELHGSNICKPAITNNAADNSMTNLVMYSTGATLFLVAVLLLARLPSVKRQLNNIATFTNYVTDAAKVRAKTLFNYQTNVVDCDDEEVNLEADVTKRLVE
jgi:hypothetical protein